MDRFIIVVEVDHNRAKKAYQKGYDEFMSIYPSLLENSRSVDEKNRQLVEIEELNIQAKYKELEKQNDKYRADYEKWQAISKWSRGLPPEKPNGYSSCPISRFNYRTPCREFNLSFFVEGLEHTKKSIKDKLDLAVAAEKNFQMTEYSVKDMIRWESGQNIEDIKETYGKQITSSETGLV